MKIIVFRGIYFFLTNKKRKTISSYYRMINKDLKVKLTRM